MFELAVPGWDPLKPALLTTGVCRDDAGDSASNPCCEDVRRKWELLQRGPVADLEYPFCRADGFFAAKQCYGLLEGHCVDRNGNPVPGKGPKETPGMEVDELCPEDDDGKCAPYISVSVRTCQLVPSSVRKCI